MYIEHFESKECESECIWLVHHSRHDRDMIDSVVKIMLCQQQKHIPLTEKPKLAVTSRAHLDFRLVATRNACSRLVSPLVLFRKFSEPGEGTGSHTRRKRTHAVNGPGTSWWNRGDNALFTAQRYDTVFERRQNCYANVTRSAPQSGAGGRKNDKILKRSAGRKLTSHGQEMCSL